MIPLLLWTGLALAKKPAPEPTPPPDPWTEPGLAALAAEIAPLVEEAAGRPFVTPPVVRYSDPEVFHAHLVAEQKRIFERVLADTPAELRDRLAEDSAFAEAAGVLGKYGIEDKVTWICGPAVRDSLPVMGLPDARAADVLRLVVAHELTHALTDQHTDLLAQVGRIHDLDGLDAAGAAWEGAATWTEQRVAERLGLTDVFDDLTGLQGWGPDGWKRDAPWRIYATYGLGRDFVAWRAAHGGTDAVWSALTTPPDASAVIFRPDRWGTPHPEPEIDAAAVLRGLEQEMTAGPWTVSNSRLGELALRGDAATADAEAELEDILGHLRWAQVLTADRPDRQAEIRLLEFDAPEAVNAYLALLKSQQEAGATEVAARIGQPVDVVWSDLPDVEADASGLRTQRIPLAGGRWKESVSAWVVRGSTCVTVTALDYRPGLRLQNTANALFARLDAARAVSAAHSSP